MKLKHSPEDFRVEELTDATPGDVGEFALYRLEKTGWTTPDALAAVRRRWQIDGRRLSYGGLKDRHAVTEQFFTIYRGPERNLTHERTTVTYLGRRQEAFTAADIRANRFTIVIRSLSERDVEAAQTAMSEVAVAGLPNYFDDQRFGSVEDPKDFVAREMVFGRFDRALWLALAAPYEHDRADAKREKKLLRDLWGNWAALREQLPRGHARSLVDYLTTHTTDLKGAVARLRPDLQGLYLSAYQSYLWNRMLGAWLTRKLGTENLAFMELKLGPVPVPRRIAEEHLAEWNSLMLPLPSARLKPDPAAKWGPIVDDALRDEGLTLPELRIKGMQQPYFSKGERSGSFRPTGLACEAEVDEKHNRRKKLTLRFELPRGVYATMLVKRVTATLDHRA